MAILIGYAILAANQIFKLGDADVVFDLKAGSWVLPYVIGMGLLVAPGLRPETA